MKHWCGKGILAADRNRGRCGRCGLSVTLPPPVSMTTREAKLLKAGKGPLLAPSIEPLMKDYVCLDCVQGRHAKCQENVMWFCNCWRAQHERPIVDREEVEEFVDEEVEEFF